MQYHEINEETARLAKSMNSFSEYREGSATKEYREMVDNAIKIADERKRMVGEYWHEKIDLLLNRYSKNLAGYYNKHYRIETMCPSIMVSGAGNFPTNKKNKQNEARDRNYKSYEKIK